MKITTKGGDEGQTSLYGGVRVAKDHPRIEANGTLDEVNTALGALRLVLGEKHDEQPLLYQMQCDIMNLMAHIATTPQAPRPQPLPLPGKGLTAIEQRIDTLLTILGDHANYFVLPGGNAAAVHCHTVRTLTRRAERRLTTLHHHEALPHCVMQYVNRMSDYFFVLALHEMHRAGITPQRYKRFKKSTTTK